MLIFNHYINYVDDMSIEHIRGTNDDGDYILFIKLNLTGNK